MDRNVSVVNHQANMLEMSLDPRQGVQSPSPSELCTWLEGGVEVIDLGDERRDTLIQPTTWHRD